LIKEDMFLHIDIVGSCNLACPSCPVANSSGASQIRKSMSVEMFRKTIEKAISECHVTCVGLYNWTEPLLHPRVDEFVEILNQNELASYISTNLNYARNLDALIRQNPTMISISLSGFNQEVYQKGHRGGNVECVKKNMLELAQAIERENASTRVVVNFHRYKDNHADLILMKSYTRELGFDFMVTDALMLPLEKVLDVSEGMTSFTETDQAVMQRLMTPVDVAIQYASKVERNSCRLINDQIEIGADGSVTLCCAVFDSDRFRIGHFLDMPITEIQQQRKSHSICLSCVNHGLDVYYTSEAVDYLDGGKG